MGWNPFSSTDKALGIIDKVAEKGLKIWDSSNFTPQDRSEMMEKLLLATKSQATSISRRQLLYFIIGLTSFFIFIAVIYNAMGMTTELNGLLSIAEQFKVSWAFVAAVSFYYITQVSMKG